MSNWLKAAFAALLIALLAVGAWFYRSQEQSVRRDVEANLQVIAQLKVEQIVQWRAERLNDGADIMSSLFFIDAVERWLTQPGKSETKQGDLRKITNRLHTLQQHQRFSDVQLVDVGGKRLAGLSAHADLLHDSALEALALALRERRPVLTDLHARPVDAISHLDIIAPLFARNGRPVAAVIMQIGADEFLYPLIQSWPGASRSAETLLVRRDGDSALLLNDIRHERDAAFKLRIPLSRIEMPAVAVVLGKQGIFEGHDYRGVASLSVLRAIPDSPWFMVTKIDADEALAEWRTRSLFILVIILGLVAMATAGAIVLQRSIAHYRALYQAEAARRKTEARYHATLMSVGDGVIATDAQGNIELMNPVAETLTGWRGQDALGKPLAGVFAIINEDTQQTVESPVEIVLREGRAVGLSNHTLLVARDGNKFPIADCGAPICDGQGRIVGVVLVFRDQTLERRTQRALRLLSESNRALVRSADVKELLGHICRIAVEVGGYRMAWIGYALHDETKSVRPISCFGVDDGYLDQTAISWADNERGQEPTGTAIRTGAVQANQDFATDPRMGEAMKRGYGASIALPLADKSGIFGALTLYAGEPVSFDAREVDLLMELASDLAYGIAALGIRAERDQALKDMRLAAKVFEESKEAIVITDAEEKILAVNRSFTAITGYAEKEVLGLKPSMFKSDRHDAGFFNELWASINQTGSWMGEIWNRRKNGEVFPVLQSISAIRDEQGNLTNYLGIFADIANRKESEARIRHLTQYDALTGLANRSLVIDRVEQAIVHARRTERLVAVIILDIDRFKLINDSLGHVAGDAVLKEVAGRLSGCIRPGDTVARSGGDEFMLVMSDVALENDVASLTRKLLGAVAAPMMVNEHEVVVTASLGVALFPKDGEFAAALLQNADSAKHRAKELGRNSVRFYAPEMNARMLERLELESGLRRAVESHEFQLYYQPKVELTRGRIVGVEALIRWRHPSMGMISPADFIPLAEDTGLIVPIGEWVLETACEQFKSWQDEGISDITLSVNLSGRQFQQENLVELVAQALRTSGLQAQYLELEITESAVMQNPQQTIAILRRLKEIGVRISLDDFGTGYSSLNYLKRFPIDALKIDQSFIREITSDPEDAAIARAVITLAHSLKHLVVAEGVETEAQLAFLRRHRCDQMQGYHFSRPLPAEEFAQLLRAGTTLEIAQANNAEAERTLLIVDDEENILAALSRLLRRDRYRVLTAASAAEGFELLALNEVQVVVADQRMPQMNGTEFLNRVKALYPDTIRLMLSGYTEFKSITDAINHGAIYKFLAKPWEDELLREHIREAFMFHESKRDKFREALRNRSSDDQIA